MSQARALIGEQTLANSQSSKTLGGGTARRNCGATDAVMVARGDLGVEMPAERVPTIRSASCTFHRKLGKPCHCRSADAGSMIDSPVPHTRRSV
jgi:pyruvate kinase